MLALGALFLAACTNLPSPPVAGSHFAGRFSLSLGPGLAADSPTPPAGGPWTGRFALQLDGEAMTLDLSTSLGATIARFETDAREARLLVPEGGRVRVERGADAQALSERVLGWSLPLAGLPDWIQGHPSVSRPHTALSGEEPGLGFEQDGWQVRVAPPPARRLQMNRPALPGLPAVALRVVLDEPGP